MTSDELKTRQELEATEAYLARLHDHKQRVEGHRDELLRRLTDNEGTDSGRWIGAR